MRRYALMDLGINWSTLHFNDYWTNIRHYIIETYVTPLKENFRVGFLENLIITKEHYYKHREDLFYIIEDLNKFCNKIENLLENPVKLLFIDEKNTFNKKIELDSIKERDLSFIIKSETNLVGQIWVAWFEHKAFIISNSIEEHIQIKFKGFIEHAKFSDNKKAQIEFLITPKYICFYINQNYSSKGSE